MSLESEVDSLNFEEFMTCHQIQDEKECLHRMLEYLNNIAPQLLDDFHPDSNKIRYLHNSVLGKKWATTPLKNIFTTQYNFDQLGKALNESIQLEYEIQKASTSSKHTTASSSHILRTYEHIILHIGVTQEIIDNIDLNDMMIPLDIINAINETVHGRLIASKYTNHEARIDSEIIRAIVLTAHAH